MSKKSLLFLLVLALAGGGYYYYHQRTSYSFLTQKKVTISGKEHDILPEEAIAKFGLEFRRVPDSRNAAIQYCKASNVYVEPDRAVKDVQYDVLEGAWRDDRSFTNWLDSNAECLELLHEAAGKPDCQFPLVGKGDDILSASMAPEHAPMRAFVRLLVCEGRRFAHKGDTSRALGSYLAASMLGQHLAQSEQTTIGTLVATACQQTGSRSIERWLANARASEDDLRNTIEQIEKNLAERPRMTDWTGSERALSQWMLDRAADDPDTAAAAMANDEQTAHAWQVFRATVGRHTEIWSRVWDEFEAWCELPAWEALRPGGTWDEVQLSAEESAYRLAFTSDLARSRTHFAKNEAQLGGMLIFTAIKLYEKKNGRPPASLSDLKGDYITELPKDAFSGRDYIYMVRGTDWILYSVWENLTDDGGRGAWPHEWGQDADLIWRNTPIPVQ